MKWSFPTLAAIGLLGLASPSPAGQVRLQILDGFVTLDAKDATAREILVEWARVGQTTVVNAERVPGGPMTLLLERVPEKQALDIVLRSVAGFVAAPRPASQPTQSQFDKILLMAAARPAVVPPTGPSAVNPPVQPQAFQRGRYPAPQPPPVVDDQDEPLPSGQMPLPGQGATQPGMPTPGAQPAGPGGQPAGGQQPQSAPMPGMQTTPVPGAPTPGAPTRPIKPPDPIIR